MRFTRSYAIILLTTSFCFGSLFTHAQAASNGDTRKKAFELFRQDKYIQALPLFEELAVKNPDDRDVLVGLGVCLVSESATLEDQDAGARERVRARNLFLKAKKLGQTSPLLDNMLQTIPEDGVVKYDNSPTAQALKAGEAAFARNDFDGAIENYQKILQLEPRNYTAVLWIGDSYFGKKDWTKAAEWYQKAIDLEPNIETAHRYYGDMLLKNGDVAGSRTRFIQAVVADPYNPITWRALKSWADTNKAELKRVHIETPNNVSQQDEKNITITMNPNDSEESSSAWLIYGMTKASWRGDQFKKRFPKEPRYRHSLDEEADALSAAATVLSESKQSGKKKNASSLPKDPNLLLLLKLQQASMIEPYVLLNAADEGIAKDYAAYREKNRKKLEEYLSAFVVPAVP